MLPALIAAIKYGGVTPLWFATVVVTAADAKPEPAPIVAPASAGAPVEAADTPHTVSSAGTDLKFTNTFKSTAVARFEPIVTFTVFDVDTPTRATVVLDD